MKLIIPEKFSVLFPVEFGGHYRPSIFKCCKSGRAGLKTWQIARALLLHSIVSPKRVFCGRETLVSLRESVLHELEVQIGLLGLQAEFEVGKNEILGNNGSQFIFGGLRIDPESLKSMGHIDFSWIEEASGVSQRSLDIFLPTVLRTPGSEVWFSYNPDQETDPVHARFGPDPINPGKSKDHDCILIESGWEDAKACGWLTPAMEKEKDKAYMSDPESAAHIWGGECSKHSDKAIFMDKVIVEAFAPQSDWIGPLYGADWGFANDPALLVKCWVSAGKLYIEEEAFGVGVDIPELPTLFTTVTGWWRYEFDMHRKRMLSTKIPLQNIAIRSDSSRPETISQMVKMNVPCVSCQKWPGCVEDGIAVLRAFGNIIIHPRCKKLVAESGHGPKGVKEAYCYKTDRKTGEVLPIIVDKFNHGWDAVRYAMEPVIMSGEKTIVHEYDSVQMNNVSISPELDMVDEMPFFQVLGGGNW
jgi:phage terminase large subunit